MFQPGNAGQFVVGGMPGGGQAGGRPSNLVPGIQSMGGMAPSVTSPGMAPHMMNSQLTQEHMQIAKLISELLDPVSRKNALDELGKRRDKVRYLATWMWHSFGVVTALLHEIVCLYTMLSPPNGGEPTLSVEASIRGCNALALLQCFAMDDATRKPFINAYIPVYLYPFLKTDSKHKAFEYLKLTSLGVIGALVKTDETQVIHFLLNTEVIPLCLQIMMTGSDLSKTVATFILQKILMDQNGLHYICQAFERFRHVTDALQKTLQLEPSLRQLKHILRCYQRLCENEQAREKFHKTGLPQELRSGRVRDVIESDDNLKSWLAKLMAAVAEAPASGATNTQTTTAV